jgi:hypothetical protein
VLATVPDYSFGSEFGLDPKCCQIGGQGRLYIQISTVVTVPGQSPNPF